MAQSRARKPQQEQPVRVGDKVDEKPEMIRLGHAEKSRSYHYPDRHSLTVKDVVAVCIRPSGSHRLETADGRKWIVLPGWEAIELDVPEWTF